MIVQTKNGPHELSHTVLEAFRSIYPTADQEFARMTIWLESNKSRRPAKPESAMRFVNAWFKRVPKRVALPAKTAAQVGTIGRLTGGEMMQIHNHQPVFIPSSPVRYPDFEIAYKGSVND